MTSTGGRSCRPGEAASFGSRLDDTFLVRWPAMAEAWHVSRTMRVLELTAFSPLSAPQVAAALHAHPRTVRRVLNQLTDDGYLQYSDDGRRVYEPTMRLVALAGQVVDTSRLAVRGQPFVE